MVLEELMIVGIHRKIKKNGLYLIALAMSDVVKAKYKAKGDCCAILCFHY